MMAILTSEWYLTVVLTRMSLIGSDAEHPFPMSLGPLYVLLGEVSVRSFAHFLIGLFVFLEWSHVSSLYILKFKPLSEVSLVSISSHSVDSLFILLMFSK